MPTTDFRGDRAATNVERSNNVLDQLCVNTIRTLAMDAVQQANSGHAGTPMALVPVVYCLWQRLLRFDPDHPIWPNRDRFVWWSATPPCCSTACCT
jgi:transketolase